MEWIVLLLAIIIIAIFILKSKFNTSQNYPYEKQPVLFTPAERSFYGVLCQASKGKAIVFGKIRVADVLKTKKGLNASRRQIAFNQISAKHFDFVLCDPADLSVLSVVELDDSSHNSKKVVARDTFLEAACEAASLKLHRFKVGRTYNINEVREAIFPPLEIQSSTPTQKPRIEPKFSMEPEKPISSNRQMPGPS